MPLKPYPSDHPTWPRHPKTGVLLVNLGTPDGTDTPSMRRYLKEFLSDRRVVEVPRLIWWLILNLIILNIRPRKSGDAYASIWLDDEDGSPLRKYTRLQAEHMAKKLAGHDDIMVDYAMRYGNPSIVSRLDKLQKEGCNRFVIVPLYPQYAASTTATVNDEVFKWALKQRWMPAIRTAPPWHDHPVYISALADSVRDHMAEHGKPDMLHLSFHGIPQRYFAQGDPYHCHCMKTARLVREELSWPSENFTVTFQSRFGREPWLQPYTDETLEKLGEQKIGNLALMAPGFVADCLETLEELAIEGEEIFHEAGGGEFHYLPCLNDSNHGMKVIEQIVKENISGWHDV